MSKYIFVIIMSIFIITITSAPIIYANNIQAITEDGRGVILHDNGTWEFSDLSKPAEVKGEEQAKELIKNLPCSRGGTVGQYLNKKAEAPSIEDLGWNVHPKEDGFEVERIFLVSQKMKSKYKWRIYKNGKVKPLSARAFGITKEK